MTMAIDNPTAPSRRDLRISSVLRSEWIKMRTVRSTMWTLAAMVVLTVGVAVLATEHNPEGGADVDGPGN